MLYSMVAAVDGSRPAIEFSIRPLFVSRSVGVSTGACFFYSSRRLDTRYWRDWSSAVCSSDLGRGLRFPPVRARLAAELVGARGGRRRTAGLGRRLRRLRAARRGRAARAAVRRADAAAAAGADRKRVVAGKSVDLGGPRILKKS